MQPKYPLQDKGLILCLQWLEHATSAYPNRHIGLISSRAIQSGRTEARDLYIFYTHIDLLDIQDELYYTFFPR